MDLTPSPRDANMWSKLRENQIHPAGRFAEIIDARLMRGVTPHGQCSERQRLLRAAQQIGDRRQHRQLQIRRGRHEAVLGGDAHHRSIE